MDLKASPWGCCTNINLDAPEQFINCILCKKSYHFHCLFMPVIPNDTEAYRKWKCTGCINHNSKTDSTPARNLSTMRGSKRPALNSPPGTAPISAEDIRAIVQEAVKSEFGIILQQINSSMVKIINENLESIKHDVSELKDSLSFHTKEFDKFQSEHASLKNLMKELKDENDQFKNTIGDLQYLLNYLEQHSRSNNLELQCVPEYKQENLYTIVKQLSSVVGCEVKDSDIQHCTRTAKL